MIALVILVVVPELGNTIINLGKTLQEFVPRVQAFAMKIFQENKEITDWIRGMEFNWDKILNQAVDFLKNGEGGGHFS